jgi:hypothetical protein
MPAMVEKQRELMSALEGNLFRQTIVHLQRQDPIVQLSRLEQHSLMLRQGDHGNIGISFKSGLLSRILSKTSSPLTKRT